MPNTSKCRREDTPRRYKTEQSSRTEHRTVHFGGSWGRENRPERGKKKEKKKQRKENNKENNADKVFLFHLHSMGNNNEKQNASVCLLLLEEKQGQWMYIFLLDDNPHTKFARFIVGSRRKIT